MMIVDGRLTYSDYFVPEPAGGTSLAADAEPFSSAFVVAVPEALESGEGAGAG